MPSPFRYKIHIVYGDQVIQKVYKKHACVAYFVRRTYLKHHERTPDLVKLEKFDPRNGDHITLQRIENGKRTHGHGYFCSWLDKDA